MNKKITTDKKLFTDLKWPLEDDLPFLYAYHFSILDTGHEVVLVFGNFIPTGLPHRSQEEVESYSDQSEIQPVAKIVMSQNGFKAFVGLIEGRIADTSEREKGEFSND